MESKIAIFDNIEYKILIVSADVALSLNCQHDISRQMNRWLPFYVCTFEIQNL